MFDNVGSKVKKLAKIICWIGIISSVISGIAIIGGRTVDRYYAPSNIFVGILVAVLGSFFSWLGSLATYAIGVSAENAEANAYKLDVLEKRINQGNQVGTSNASVPSTKPATTSNSNASLRSLTNNNTSNQWRCPDCGTWNNRANILCNGCGKYR